jgi:hypothetical protein
MTSSKQVRILNGALVSSTPLTISPAIEIVSFRSHLRLFRGLVLRGILTFETKKINVVTLKNRMSGKTFKSFAESPLQECPPPVALWICRESRRYTLKQCKIIQHPKAPAGSFFFSAYSRHSLVQLRPHQGFYMLNGVSTLL